MAAVKAQRRALLLVIVVALLASLFPLPTVAVTRSQVDEACAESSAQLAEYRAAQGAFEQAALGFDEALHDVERVEAKQERIVGTLDSHSEDLLAIQSQIEEQAVQLYMMGGLTNTGAIFSASSVDEFMATSEFLSAAATGGQESIDDLLAARSELGRFQEDLTDTRLELQRARSEALDFRDAQQVAMEAEQAAYSELHGECRSLKTKYDQEQAEAEARRRQRAAGSIQVGSFICPFTRGRTSFIDSWGDRRSGGRTHKGTDLFAAWNEPVYAVAAGRVSIRNSGLGGLAIWLTASNGVAYYYAHLNSFNVSNGQTVSQGQTIGFNGDSGNARGGSPHVHFEIHVGGGGSAASNPYPTLVGVCK